MLHAKFAGRLIMDRRNFRAAAAVGLAAPGLVRRTFAADQPKVINLGFQKTGIPLVARQLKVFERRFEPKGIAINWVEFTQGLLLLQALDLGDISFGNSGNVGCIFVQAAGGHIAYVAAQPSAPKGEGILVKANSAIKTLADLKGKKVAYAAGSSSHNLIAAALQKAGLSLNDIETVNLGASDAIFAYENDNVDAWVIWDPYFTIGQSKAPSRVLAFSGDVLKDSAGFLLANSQFAADHPDLVQEFIAGSREAGDWAKAHIDDVTTALAATTGIDKGVMTTVDKNASFDVVPLSNAILDGQQATADRLLNLKLIPTAVKVRDIVWAPAAPKA
jgi:sulfonate transport system substrate-binding protein